MLGKQALNVATDMIGGKSFKDSVKDRLNDGINTIDREKPFSSLAAERE